MGGFHLLGEIPLDKGSLDMICGSTHPSFLPESN